jgi:ABC-2 type transport system ATP-binding protein
MLRRPVGHKPTLARVGYLPEHHSFPPYLTGEQVLDFYAALNRVDRATRRRRIPELLELVGMGPNGREEPAKRRVGTYSKGMRQRIGIAQALMNDPELVLLDEPTDGVDPVGRRDIRDIVQRLSEGGKAVFLNSHILSELEMVTDRVAILLRGRVAKHGTLDDLTAGKRSYDIEVVAGDADRLRAALGEQLGARETPPPENISPPEGAASLSLWADDGGATGALVAGRTLRLFTEDAGVANRAMAGLHHGGITAASMKPVRPTLEDLFIEAVAELDAAERVDAGDGRGGP